MMDDISSSSKSNSLNGEEWLDLSKSDYAKVIFSNLYWNSDSGSVGCHFKLTETVNKNPYDYIGLYKVGYENLSQCLALKKINELEGENDAKLIHCIFNSEELPELNGFYQFLYVTQDKEVSGASMPFAVNNFKSRNNSSDDEVITEKVEDDFIMVRYGMEQKNDLLEVMLQRLQSEKLSLTNQLHQLSRDKDEVTSEYDATKLQLDTLLAEFVELKEEKEALINDLETIKKEKAAVSYEFEVVKEKIISELAIITKSADDLSNELSTVKVERDNLYSDLEDCKNEKVAMISKLEQLVNQLKNAEEEKSRIVSELDICVMNNSNLASELAKSHSELTALKVKNRENEAKLQQQILNKQLSTLDHNTQLMKSQLEEAELERNKAVQMRCNAEMEARRLNYQICDYKRYFQNKEEFDRYCLWQSNEEITKQLEESEIMLKAMENSKQLVLKEMAELTERLKEANEELCHLRCENIHLKRNLKEWNEINLGSTTEKDKALKKELIQIKEELTRVKCENICLKVNLKDLNEKEQNNKMENEMLELDKKLKEQEAMLSEEKSKLEEELLMCQRKYEDKLPISKALYFKLKEKNPKLEEHDFENELHNLIDQFETHCVELHRLETECSKKDLKLEDLVEEIKQLRENEVAALNDVAERTARLAEAAEMYKDLYIGKQKLLKKMNKIVYNKTKRSLMKVLEDTSEDSSSESDFLPLNIKASKQLSSSNSDSDTGEHFCPQMTPLQVKELNFQTFVPEKETLAGLQQGSLIQCTEDITDVNEKSFNSSEQKSETQSLVSVMSECSSSDENMYDIPCQVCGKSFPVSSTSNIPLLEHYEMEHNLNMCPVCGQLFEKCVPPKYLNYHINKHFESK